MEYKIYESLENIRLDNSLTQKEKLILCQLLDMCVYRKKYDEANYRKFVEKVKLGSPRNPPRFPFSKIGLLKVPIKKRKEYRWEEVQERVEKLEKELEKSFFADSNFTKNPPSFINDFYKKFIEEYGIIPTHFQLNGWEKIFFSTKQFLVITAPTGFGKTEVFLLPIIFSLFHQRYRKLKSFHSIFIYPRRILIEDQASRLLTAIRCIWELFKREQREKIGMQAEELKQPIIIGIQKGEIPRNFDKEMLEKNKILIKKGGEYYLHLIKCLHGNKGYDLKLTDDEFDGGLKGVFQCCKCGTKFFISLSRDNHKKILEKNYPFILLTTFESLERLFLEEEYLTFFKNLRYIVIDESHQYSSIYGLHISYIFKKLYEILQTFKVEKEIKVIFSSATLPKPRETIAKFLSPLGVNPEEIDEIRVPQEDITVTDKYKYFIILLTKRHVFPLKTFGLIQTCMYFSHVINRLYDKPDKKIKSLVFFDTKGSLYRLSEQYNDAEKRQLMKYRLRRIHDPSIPDEHNWNKIFEISNKMFRVEELTAPVEATCITSEFKERGDLMFCTSALELGIDDPTINTIIQYGSPRSILSFVQRVGRANRIEDDRFFVTLMEYTDPVDTFYFANNWLLTEEAFEREGIFIPTVNEIVERIHYLTSLVNKGFISLYPQKKEMLSKDQIILEVFHSVLEKEKLSLDIDFIQLISNLKEKGSNEEIQEFLEGEKKKLKDKAEKLSETMRYREVREIIIDLQEAINNFLHQINKSLILTSPTKEEILSSKEIDTVKEKINQIIKCVEEIEKINPNEIFRLIREIENSIGELRDKYSKDIFRKGLETPCIDFLDKLHKIYKDMMQLMENLKDKEGFERKQRELDEIFLKRIGIEKLISGFIFTPALGRMRTVWEKFICLFQACFWFNVSYLVKQNEFFEKYEEMLSRLPYIPLSYFEESTEFPVNFKIGNKLKEGHIVSDCFIRYFPFKVDFEVVENRRKVPTTFYVDINLRPVDENTFEIIGIKNLWGIPKKEEKNTYYLPLQVPLKRVKEDTWGYVRFCRNCKKLSSFKDSCDNCGGRVEKVKIHGKPLFDFKISEKSPIKKVKNFSFSPISALVMLKGSENQFYYYGGNRREEILLKFKYPLIFPLFSQALIIDLGFVRNEDCSDKLLHSLAHLFLKVLASLTEFSEEMFFYSFDKEKKKIYIFERYQGGLGSIERFFEILEKRPEKVKERIEKIISCAECEDGCTFCIWLGWCKDGFRNQAQYVSKQLLREFMEKYKEFLF